MRTPWSSLLEHGTAVAALFVMCLAGICLILVVTAAVVITKFLVFIR